MVLARDLAPLNPYSHENDNKGNKENLKSWIKSKQEYKLKNLDVKAIYKIIIIIIERLECKSNL